MTNLSIGKDGGVVALKAAFDETLRALAVDGVLMGVRVEDVVVGEGFVFAQDQLGLPGHDIRADVAALDPLLGQLRTNPGGR